MLRRHVLPALVLLLALTGCGRDDDDDPTITVPSELPTSTATTAAEPTAAASGIPTDDVAQTIALTVADGKVTGDSGRVQVRLGSRIRISVTADVADEVHVHGYDLRELTAPGTTVQIELTAATPGVFEVELEERKLVLARLQVA